jgi:hypothetical protein
MAKLSPVFNQYTLVMNPTADPEAFTDKLANWTSQQKDSEAVTYLATERGKPVIICTSDFMDRAKAAFPGEIDNAVITEANMKQPKGKALAGSRPANSKR